MTRVEQAVLRGGGAVIAGEAGIGKSHTARAAAARLRTRGAEVEFILATEAASSVPFGALAALLEPSIDTPADLLEVLRSTGGRLAHRAAGGLLVLCVDDAHRLDRASAALLLQLATRHGIKVLATLRSGVRAPDAVTSLWKDGPLIRVDLGPLDQGGAADVARHLLNGPLERDTQTWLWQTSGGNPLFLRELVRSAVDQGGLVQERGHWRRSGPVPPSQRLLDLLDERIEALSSAERRALALVVLSEPAPLGLLERLGALEAASRLESRGLLVAADTAGGAGLRAGHPLYGEALRASLKLTETRELHAELAGQLDPRDPNVRLRLATWALDDGRPGDDGELAEAAEQALAAFDPELAIRLAGAARERRLDVALPLAAALRAAGRFEEAEDRLAEVEHEALASPRITSYLFVRATNLSWALGRHGDADALLGRVEVEPSCSAVGAALRSVSGELTDSVAGARRALASPGTDRQAHAIAAIVVGHDLALLGDPQTALGTLDRVDRSLQRFESEMPRAAIGALAAFYAGEQWTERQQALERRLVAVRAEGDDARAALCEVALTRLGLGMGELDQVRRWAGDSLARLAFLDPRATAPICHAAIAEAEAHAGQAQAARAALRQGLALAPPGNLMATQALQTAEVLVLAIEGDHPRAQELALACAAGAAEAVLLEAEMMHLHLSVGGTAGAVARRLREIADSSSSGLAILWARQAEAADLGDGAALEAVAGDYERIGARIYAAEAAAQAAAAYGARRNGDARNRAEARASRLAAACGAHGLTLVRMTRVSELTARERETAQLVARGLTNAEIAGRLSVSVRSVESYVYRATTKLGLHDRAELGRLIDRGRRASRES
jgi:DNA-binding CsgD family transcriptional regulator